MKTFIVFLLILLGSNYASSQSLSVFNLDGSTFPIVKANFFALDSKGNPIINLSNKDISLKEDGLERKVLSISCPEPKPPVALSSVLVMDVSGSMGGTGIEIANAAANAWIDMLPLGFSECAVTSFSNENYLNQDFTTNKTKLVDGINSLNIIGGTDYDAAMINPIAGGLLIAKTGKHKRIVVFLSDGGPNNAPLIAQIISEANANNISIYCVTIGFNAPQCMQDFSNNTGGKYFDNIKTVQEAEDCYRTILAIAQGGGPCEIAWEGSIKCSTERIKAQFSIPKINLSAETRYQSPDNSIAELEFQPKSVKFLKALPGIKRDTTITVTAQNVDFDVTNITSTNADYTINPAKFKLKQGERIDLRVSYLPQDSGYTFCKFTFENSYCSTNYSVRGGFPGKSAKIKTLKLIHPNGGQEFVVGSDTVITWEGVLTEDKVRLEYSTDKGAIWKLISDTASGFEYKWYIPNTPSKNCMVKITAYNDEKELIICNQVWMRRNLDVEYYRNGDEIPEQTKNGGWGNIDTGAYCFYDDSPELGSVYGKLYNWFAVNDPRGLAPEGWHIASDSEWVQVEECLGGDYLTGNKLKEAGTAHWKSPNTGATNESGFTALPGGNRMLYGTMYLGEYGFWWTSTEKEEPAGWQRLSAWSRGMYYGFPNVGRNAYTKYDGLSVRCVRDLPASYNQTDQSDSVFSIVAPEAKANDIDMKKCLVGSLKDSLITDFIINSGAVKFRVDSIYCSGTDAKAFQLASNFPKYEITPAETKPSEINFKPYKIGLHNAFINIITQSDTLTQRIVGEGVAPKLEVISKLLDFGIVNLGNQKTFQDTTLIKNISNTPFTIDNVVQLGPDKMQFEVLSGGGQFTLQPNETRKLTVRFKPIYEGRTSGQIGFEYNGVGSPAIVQLFGAGVGKLIISIKNDSAYAGQVRRLKLMMSNIEPEDIAAYAPNFSAKIRFQKTILTPIKKADRTIINDSTYVNISGTFGTSYELAQIPVVAGLGNVEETSIDIVDFSVKDNAGNKIDYETETQSGWFKLLGICREGGTRLINPTGKTEIMQIIPNPASDDIEINVNLIEEGFSTVSVFNSNGVKLREYSFQDGIGLKTININARDFDNGLYFIQLLTPTVVDYQKLMIVK